MSSSPASCLPSHSERKALLISSVSLLAGLVLPIGAHTWVKVHGGSPHSGQDGNGCHSSLGKEEMLSYSCLACLCPPIPQAGAPPLPNASVEDSQKLSSHTPPLLRWGPPGSFPSRPPPSAWQQASWVQETQGVPVNLESSPEGL